MAGQSSVHAYLNWAKQRIDEMDAALASLEAAASDATAQANAKTHRLIAELQERRDEFQKAAQESVEAGETAWRSKREQLESQWQDFEAHLKTYFETAGKKIEQQQATFREIASAQAKAWREAADQLHGEAAKMAAERRAEIEAAVKQLEANATNAEAHLRKMNEAGSASWAVFSAALSESRKSFDRASQQAWDALKRAATEKV